VARRVRAGVNEATVKDTMTTTITLTHRHIARLVRSATLGAALLVAAFAAQAAGFVVNAKDEARVSIGMTRDEVRSALGRPAHNMKYRSEPGRTWTYGVVGSDDKVFDIDFSAEGKVSKMGERAESFVTD
jgi:outer membrane protein assembly factor BamE (lipoprotein component of BamABCDE complex)